MSVEEENVERGFPKQALGVLAGASLLSVILELFLTGEILSDLLEASDSTGGLIFALLIALVTGFIITFLVNYLMVAVHFLFIYFPTKWISKESHVYKYEMWKAFFYTYSIMSLFSILINQTTLTQELWFMIVTSVLTAGLFLLFYLNEGEKKGSVKKAVLIVTPLVLAINIGLSIFGHSYTETILEDIDIEEIE